MDLPPGCIWMSRHRTPAMKWRSTGTRRWFSCWRRRWGAIEFFLLCFRKPSLYPFLNALGKSSEGLVGRDVGPGGAALHTLRLLEMDSTLAELGRFQGVRNLFFQAFVKILVNLLLDVQELIKRVVARPGSPMDAVSQFGHVGQVVRPEIVEGGEG